jgi:hypothetical protein
VSVKMALAIFGAAGQRGVCDHCRSRLPRRWGQRRRRPRCEAPGGADRIGGTRSDATASSRRRPAGNAGCHRSHAPGENGGILLSAPLFNGLWLNCRGLSPARRPRPS